MDRLAWNTTWEMGDARIDGQHQAMVAGINRLAEAMEAGRGEEEVGQAISFLTVYVRAHFVHEENLMAHYGYPDLDEHRTLHVACGHKVEALLNTFRRGGHDTLAELVGFLHYWLTNHLEREDRLLAAFLREREVLAPASLPAGAGR